MIAEIGGAVAAARRVNWEQKREKRDHTCASKCARSCDAKKGIPQRPLFYKVLADG